MSHVLIERLDAISALRADRLKPYWPRVRDRDDISVLRCDASEVIVLSSIDHVVDTGYYEDRREEAGVQSEGERIMTPRLDDNIRRARDFGSLIRGRHWLDVGCGLGGMLDELGLQATSATGLEPNRDRSVIVARKGHAVVSDFAELVPASLDIVTFFHVLEHIPHPIEILHEARKRLKPQGMLLIEVPHARDALFSLYNCDAFKAFTFWSEHLVLYTRNSLRLVLEASGFTQIEVSAYQRYPLANHLYWLARGSPGGHEKWAMLTTGETERSDYENALACIDRTDTLIATARVP